MSQNAHGLTFHSLTSSKNDKMATAAEAELDDQNSGEKQWQNGICGCFTYPLSCLGVTFCETCSLGQLSSLSRGGSRTICIFVFLFFFILGIVGFALQLDEDTQMAGFVIGIVMTFLACFVLLIVRVTIRNRERIQGTICEDVLTTFFCSPCSMCQILNEVGRPYRGFWASYAALPQEDGDDRV